MTTSDGREKTKTTTIFVLHEAVLPVRLELFKIEKKDEIETRKNKRFKSFFLSYEAPLCASGWEGQSLSVQQSAPTPLSWISMPWKKSSHFMSTVLQNRNSNKFQHEYSNKTKKHLMFKHFFYEIG